MSSPASPVSGDGAGAGRGASVPAFRVARSQRMHLYVVVVCLIVVVTLATVPLWAKVGTSRTLITLFGLIALAQMWNLLGGFAGLISVGQQAYIGIGAYGLWFFADRLHVHPFLAVPCAAVAGRPHRAADRPAAVPASGRLLRHRHLGVRGGRAHHRVQHPGHGRRLGQDRHLGRQHPVRDAHPRHVLDRAGRGGRLRPASSTSCCAPSCGLALTAIRDNDLAAQSSGVNVFRSKLIVFVVAAFGCGAMGAVVALNLLFIQPAASFSINWTAFAIFIVVIGGFGSIEGPLIGAIIFFALQQTLSQYGSTYFLLLGVIAVIMATKAPRGIWGWIVERWDLHLFPVRRSLVLDAPAEAAPEAPAGPAPEAG